MTHVKLDKTNEAHQGTQIEAQADFFDEYVFRADAELADTGVIVDGLVGRGNDRGAGVVGLGGEEGGVGVRGTGGSSRQVGEVHMAGTGVVGTGGFVRKKSREFPGAGVIGLGTGSESPSPQESAGVGVFGKGAKATSPGSVVGGTGVVGVGSYSEQGRIGAGVVGISTAIQLPNPKETEGIGVYGYSETGPGVVGIAASNSLDSRGDAGVVGRGDSGPGAEFSSDMSAQVHLVPSKDAKLPKIGRRGDLWIHYRPGRVRHGQNGVSLYICVEDRGIATWQRVLLDSTRIAGGSDAP
jgi:hypothetical protein